LQFISDSEESGVVSLGVVNSSLSIELLTVAETDHAVKSAKHKQLVNSGINAVKVLDALDYSMTKMYIGSNSDCSLCCIDYNLDGSVYTQLTSNNTSYTKNRKRVLNQATYAFGACDRGANAAMLIGASDGIYV